MTHEQAMEILITPSAMAEAIRDYAEKRADRAPEPWKLQELISSKHYRAKLSGENGANVGLINLLDSLRARKKGFRPGWLLFDLRNEIAEAGWKIVLDGGGHQHMQIRALLPNIYFDHSKRYSAEDLVAALRTLAADTLTAGGLPANELNEPLMPAKPFEFTES